MTGKSHNIVVLTLILLFAACTPTVEPINYGHDSCEHCKMIIMDQRWGNEIVTDKGKIYKFDDLSCLVLYMKSNQMKEEDLAHLMVSDYSDPGSLLPANEAWYVKSENLRSPMAGGIAAFSSKNDSGKFIDESGGIEMNWAEVFNYFK